MSLKVEHYIDADQLKRDIAFTEANITEAYMDQAALYVEYARLAQQAEYQADRFKINVEVIEAKVDQEFRDNAVESKTKMTEAHMNRMLMADSRVSTMKKKYNEAKSIASMAKSALEAIKQRRDMLIQTGADLREEQKGQLRMNAGSQADQAKEKLLKAMGE